MVEHQTLGRGVPGSICPGGIVCCGLAGLKISSCILVGGGGGGGQPDLTGRLSSGQPEILQQVFDLILLSGAKVQIHNNTN